MAAVDQTGRAIEDVVRTYRALGVVALQNYFSASRVTELIAESDRLLEKLRAGEIDPLRIAYRPTVGGGETFERFDPVCDIAPVCKDVARDQRLLDLVRGLIGGKPFLFKDKLIYKLEGDRGYGLHQDYPYYDLTESLKDGVATIVVAIDGISPDSGGLQFVLDRHHGVQPAPKDQPKDVDPAAVAGAIHWDAALPAGSLIAFHTLTPHGSGPNLSGRARRLLYLTYVCEEFSYVRDSYYRARSAERRPAPSSIFSGKLID